MFQTAFKDQLFHKSTIISKNFSFAQRFFCVLPKPRTCRLAFPLALGRNLVAHHQSPEPGDGKALVVRLASACLQLQLCVPWDEGRWGVGAWKL